MEAQMAPLLRTSIGDVLKLLLADYPVRQKTIRGEDVYSIEHLEVESTGFETIAQLPSFQK